jgi:hypothetical protein
VIALLVLLACAIPVAVILLSDSSEPRSPSSASSSEPAGQRLTGDLTPVPFSKVNGVGEAVVKLNGDVATVSLNTRGLLDSPHAMHIHAGARGECPPGRAAHNHGGHPVIATGDGVPWYGPPVTALTTTGGTTIPKSLLAFKRFPTVGRIRYHRPIDVGPVVASYIRNKNAVIVVHGIDYNDNGAYDFSAIDHSDLGRSLPGEITAPALCGTLVPVPAARPTGSAGAKTGRVPGRGQIFTASLKVDSAPKIDRPSLGLLCPLGGATGDQRKHV